MIPGVLLTLPRDFPQVKQRLFHAREILVKVLIINGLLKFASRLGPLPNAAWRQTPSRSWPLRDIVRTYARTVDALGDWCRAEPVRRSSIETEPRWQYYVLLPSLKLPWYEMNHFVLGNTIRTVGGPCGCSDLAAASL